jgi:threonine dehydrogenase-like Zn-dependent dehydrogenase
MCRYFCEWFFKQLISFSDEIISVFTILLEAYENSYRTLEIDEGTNIAPNYAMVNLTFQPKNEITQGRAKKVMVMAVPHQSTVAMPTTIPQAVLYAIAAMRNAGATGIVGVAVLDYWSPPTWTVHFYQADLSTGASSFLASQPHNNCGAYLVQWMRYNASRMGFLVE